MSKQIKLIWDFKGPVAHKTAEHHLIHLKEYLEIENWPKTITGCSVISDMHSIAFMVVSEDNMIAMRDALKPHRGEIYQPN